MVMLRRQTLGHINIGRPIYPFMERIQSSRWPVNKPKLTSVPKTLRVTLPEDPLFIIVGYITCPDRWLQEQGYKQQKEKRSHKTAWTQFCYTKMIIWYADSCQISDYISKLEAMYRHHIWRHQGIDVWTQINFATSEVLHVRTPPLLAKQTPKVAI